MIDILQLRVVEEGLSALHREVHQLREAVRDKEAQIALVQKRQARLVLQYILEQRMLPLDGWVERTELVSGDVRLSIRGDVTLPDNLLGMVPKFEVVVDQRSFHLGEPEFYLEWFGPSRHYGPGRLRLGGEEKCVCEAVETAGLNVEWRPR